MQLTIETTGRQGSIAILDGDAILASKILPQQHRTAMSLAPEIQQMMTSTGVTRDAVKFISVAIGPGSFTGLRVGVTTAKTLSFAWGIPLVAVGSLAAIAAETFRCHPSTDQLCVAIEAYRGQAYTADFTNADLADDRICDSVERASAIDRKELSDKIAHQPSAVFTSGDQKLFSDPARFLGRECDAIGVGVLAHRLAKLQQWSDPMTVAPTYLKPSAAEEEADSQDRNQQKI